MPAGRPTKYKPEYAEQLIEFFDQEPYNDVDIPHYKNAELAWTDTKRLPGKLPTMVGFWKHLKERGDDVGLRTLYDWIDKNHESYQEEFSHAYIHVAKRLQKDFLIQNGLQGQNNPVYAKFIAINLTDMSDKVDHSLSDPDGVVREIVRTIVDPEVKQ